MREVRRRLALASVLTAAVIAGIIGWQSAPFHAGVHPAPHHVLSDGGSGTYPPPPQ